MFSCSQKQKQSVEFRKLDKVERSKSALEVEAKERTPKPEVSMGYDYGMRNPNHTEEPEPGDYFFSSKAVLATSCYQLKLGVGNSYPYNYSSHKEVNGDRQKTLPL